MVSQMIRFSTGAAAVLFALTALLSPASTRAGSPGAAVPCGPLRGETLMATSGARIYRLGGGVPRAYSIYGCLRSSVSSVRLGPIRKEGKLASSMTDPFALVASWAGAFESEASGQDGFFIYAISRNLRNGAWHRCRVNGADRPHPNPSALLMDRSGDVAWAVMVPGGAGTVVVGVCEGNSRRIAAEGTEIDPNSLRLNGSTLRWLNAGISESTALGKPSK
jgi:hypothetical protein